ncbi:hypothetical protein [Aromatoleum sp.]|uniref:hypothetical protein n=1 Tax=Aromatoleum sp. TaxID=2307007 RepID=UPI002FC9B78D
MTFDEFIDSNRGALVGYYLLSKGAGNVESLEVPVPASSLSDEALEEFKYSINECMPLSTMITDLWDWNIHFENEEYLGDDWYFDAIFGAPSSLQDCAGQLAEFFIDECGALDVDYDHDLDDPVFVSLVQEHAERFIEGWRKNLYARVQKNSRSRQALE